jgi:hypothetical protein
MATSELMIEAPAPELALPAEPDYQKLPNDVLKTIIANALRRSESIGDSTDPEDVQDKGFSDAQALKVQSILDSRESN